LALVALRCSGRLPIVSEFWQNTETAVWYRYHIHRHGVRLVISRRKFLQSASAACVAGSLSTSANARMARGKSAAQEDPLQWVELRTAIGGHGHCFPGASMPFGAVQLSPDTYNDGWDWCSGYHFSDTSIMGFSHTHLSGTGCGDLLDFLVMAGTGPAHTQPGTRENPDEGYRSRFDHADEQMEPGYYSVILKDYKIRAEMTTTDRAGIHRYTFPASDQAYLILDLKHGYGGGEGPVTSAELRQTAPDALAGGHVTSAWGPNRHAYFAMQVSKKPERVVFYNDDAEVAAPAAGTDLTGKNLKAGTNHGQGLPAIHGERLELPFCLGRRGLGLEIHMELVRHDRRHPERSRHPCESHQRIEVGWSVNLPPAFLFVRQVGLLAYCRAEHEGGIPPREVDEFPDQLIHLPVPEKDRRFILRRLFGGQLYGKDLGLHVAPVEMLIVRCAVQEKGGEPGLDLLVIVAEHVELQLVEDHGPLPSILPP